MLPRRLLVRIRGCRMLQRFLLPFEHVQFDEDERDEPEHSIPEIDAAALDAPIDGRILEKLKNLVAVERQKLTSPIMR